MSESTFSNRVAAHTAGRRPRAIVYCDRRFGTRSGSVANELVEHSERYDIVAVIDATHVGRDASAVLGRRPTGIPCCRDLDDAIVESAGNPDLLIVGLAPSSNELSAHDRSVLLDAIARGLGIVNGLHTILSDDAEFAAAAEAADVDLIDVCRPALPSELRTFIGSVRDVTCPRVAVVGAGGGCGVGSTARILTEALRTSGHEAILIGTGPTTMLQGAWHGVVIDSVPAASVAAQLEAVIVSACTIDRPDVVVVEGHWTFERSQSRTTSSILEGSRAQAVVVHHSLSEASNETAPDAVRSMLASEIAWIESHGDTRVIGLSIACERPDGRDLVGLVDLLERGVDLPVVDASARAVDRLERLVESIESEFADLVEGRVSGR